MQELVINANRIDIDEAYMQMAEIWAKRSKANRKQVGALIVKNRQIISDGYNGLPAGDEDDVCEEWHRDPSLGSDELAVLRTRSEVLHAESNALIKIAAGGGVGADGGTLYTTLSPCQECAKLIKQAKIARVVFREQYHDSNGIDFLLKRGVHVEQLIKKNQSLEDRLGSFQTNNVSRALASPSLREHSAPAQNLSVEPVLPLKREPLMASVANAAAPAANLIEPPKINIAVPPILEQTDEEIAAMLEAAMAKVIGAPPAAQHKSTPNVVDDGAYKSSFL